jgi:hypothetical protein
MGRSGRVLTQNHDGRLHGERKKLWWGEETHSNPGILVSRGEGENNTGGWMGGSAEKAMVSQRLQGSSMCHADLNPKSTNVGGVRDVLIRNFLLFIDCDQEMFRLFSGKKSTFKPVKSHNSSKRQGLHDYTMRTLGR